MTNREEIQAMKIAANRYCDAIAWPTLVLALGATAGFLLIPLAAALGLISLWIATPAMAFVYYASYTPLHEAVHGAVCGGGRKYRWLNDAVGYVSGVVVGLPYTAHRHEHFLHHAHTNIPGKDPDLVCAGMSRGLWAGLVGSSQMMLNQYTIFFRDRWTKDHTDQKVRFVLEIVTSLGIRLLMAGALVSTVTSSGQGTLIEGLWLAFLMLFVAYEIGLLILVYLFAYIVHTPHSEQGKYVDTSVFVLPAWVRTLGTWCWGFQNYHGVHHAFPRVPWFRYKALYEEQKQQLHNQSLPVHELNGLRWQRQN